LFCPHGEHSTHFALGHRPAAMPASGRRRSREARRETCRVAP